MDAARPPSRPSHAARPVPVDPIDQLLRPTPRVPLGWPPSNRMLVGVAAAVAVACVGWLTLARSHPVAELTLPRATTATAATSDAARSDGPVVGLVTTTVGDLMVHVAGAVNRAGVVRLPAGARVQDAVGAAGGLRDDADGDRLNLAAPVLDGERVYVVAVGQAAAPTASGPSPGPSPGGSASGSAGTTAGGPIDLNSATADQLDALPGVGPATAAAIIAYRDRHGPFQRVEDLLDVRGIGDAKLDALRDSVTVGP